MRVSPSESEIGIYTFGDKVVTTLPRPAVNYLIHVAGLRDPMSNRGFSKTYTDGRPIVVQDFVKEDPRYEAILDSVRFLAHVHLRSEARDNKWLSMAIVDHHGKWIAPAVGELVSHALDYSGYKVSLFHFDLMNGGLK